MSHHHLTHVASVGGGGAQPTWAKEAAPPLSFSGSRGEAGRAELPRLPGAAEVPG